jgi:hypothetical protein
MAQELSVSLRTKGTEASHTGGGNVLTFDDPADILAIWKLATRTKLPTGTAKEQQPARKNAKNAKKPRATVSATATGDGDDGGDDDDPSTKNIVARELLLYCGQLQEEADKDSSPVPFKARDFLEAKTPAILEAAGENAPSQDVAKGRISSLVFKLADGHLLQLRSPAQKKSGNFMIVASRIAEARAAYQSSLAQLEAEEQEDSEQKKLEPRAPTAKVGNKTSAKLDAMKSTPAAPTTAKTVTTTEPLRATVPPPAAKVVEATTVKPAVVAAVAPVAAASASNKPNKPKPVVIELTEEQD